MNSLPESIELFEKMSLNLEALANHPFLSDTPEEKDKLINKKTHRQKDSFEMKTQVKNTRRIFNVLSLDKQPKRDQFRLNKSHSTDNKCSLSEINTQVIVFNDNEGWEIRQYFCGMKIRIGPFSSIEKAKKVVNYLRINNIAVDNLNLKEKKQWVYDFVDLIQFVIL